MEREVLAESVSVTGEAESADLAALKATLGAGLTATTFRTGVTGAAVTTFAIGGELPLLCEINSSSDLATVVTRCREVGVAYRTLGNGSNLLVPDAGVHQVVITLGASFRTFSQADGMVSVGAGFSLMTLSRKLSEAGFAGLEFAGGIPASIGGAVFMNAGAHGSEMAQLLRSVTVVTGAGEIQKLRAQDLPFRYRHSGLAADMVVVEAEVQLVQGDASAISARRAEFLAERKRRQPLAMPSAGSIFRNPTPERPAGKLIDDAGLRGHWHGQAQISEQHGNWIVNPHRKATAADVEGLITEAQKVVQQRFGIDLVPELVRW